MERVITGRMLLDAQRRARTNMVAGRLAFSAGLAGSFNFWLDHYRPPGPKVKPYRGYRPMWMELDGVRIVMSEEDMDAIRATYRWGYIPRAIAEALR